MSGKARPMSRRQRPAARQRYGRIGVTSRIQKYFHIIKPIHLQDQTSILPTEKLPVRNLGKAFARVVKSLEPGLITGAADDDPSGIATYSSVGAQFGYGMLWTMPLIYPFMASIQEVSARVGRVTGKGIVANLLQCYPRWLVYILMVLLLFANTINLGADIGAMGDSDYGFSRSRLVAAQVDRQGLAAHAQSR